MNINIICVGKIKEKFFRDALAEYSKRLSRYCKLNILEVPDEKTPDNASEKEEELIKEKEGLAILKVMPENCYNIALCIEGKMMSSEKLSEHMDSLASHGASSINFIIGGSLGLSKKVTTAADFHLSFSPMTFPHQLMRVVLLEQIYRSFRIRNGEPYHK